MRPHDGFNGSNIFTVLGLFFPYKSSQGLELSSCSTLHWVLPSFQPFQILKRGISIRLDLNSRMYTTSPTAEYMSLDI